MIKFLNIFKKKKPLSFYQKLGEAQGLQELVASFYQIMLTDPKARNCLSVHELKDGGIDPESSEKLFFFLSGWLGGANLFVQNVGAPRMRMRHAHINISEIERDEWIYCMQKAVSSHSHKVSKVDQRKFIQSITALAMRIQNQ